MSEKQTEKQDGVKRTVTKGATYTAIIIMWSSHFSFISLFIFISFGDRFGYELSYQLNGYKVFN